MKPWEQYIPPHRVYGNVYFVGARCGSSHLIESDDGLILLDSGYPQTLYLVIENIRALGFDPKNIKHILHSHGHYDHLGGTRALVELYGAKTYLGEGTRSSSPPTCWSRTAIFSISAALTFIFKAVPDTPRVR